MVCDIHNLTSRLFEQLEITSPIYVYQRVNCMQLLLRGSALKKSKAVLMECKELAKELAGYQWNLGEIKDVNMD